jgi:hypothetical protein
MAFMPCDSLRNLTPPATWTLCNDDEDTTTENEPTGTAGAVTDDPDILPSTSSTPHLVTQDELTGITRDLNLPKTQAERLCCRLRGWNLLEKNVKITSFRQQ